MAGPSPDRGQGRHHPPPPAHRPGPALTCLFARRREQALIAMATHGRHGRRDNMAAGYAYGVIPMVLGGLLAEDGDKPIFGGIAHRGLPR
jgi:hypothetical protein